MLTIKKLKKRNLDEYQKPLNHHSLENLSGLHTKCLPPCHQPPNQNFSLSNNLNNFTDFKQALNFLKRPSHLPHHKCFAIWPIRRLGKMRRQGLSSSSTCIQKNWRRSESNVCAFYKKKNIVLLHPLRGCFFSYIMVKAPLWCCIMLKTLCFKYHNMNP